MTICARKPWNLALAALLLTSALGCLVPLDPGLDADLEHPDQHDPSPTPRMAQDQGAFSIRFSGLLDGSLDADARGEATYTFTEGSPGFFATHCQISLVDQEQGASNTVGLITLRFYHPTCTPEGTYTLRHASTLSAEEKERGQNLMVIQRVEVEQGADTPKVFEFRDMGGMLTIHKHEGGELSGTLSLSSDAAIEDESRERQGRTTFSGDFTAEWQPLTPGTPAPR